MSTKRVNDLLQEKQQHFTPLQRLLRKASDQKQWTQELRALLEPPLNHEVEVSAIKGSTAVILCHGAAAATRLRFLLPSLEERLRVLQSFSGVEHFDIRVSTSRS